MTDSERAVKWRPSHEPARLLRQPKFSFVDSIKEGFRRISGCREPPEPAKKERPAQRMGVVGPAHPMDTAEAPHDALRAPRATVRGGEVVGVRRKWRGNGRGGEGEGSRTSFELYLATIPRLNPIDRTVGWVIQQPHCTQVHCDSYSNLPPRGMIVPGVTRSESRGVCGTETSLSRYESDRGTHGRGTPPAREEGRPRLDELFRQLQLKQEREACRRLVRGGEGSTLSNNLLNIQVAQVPGYPPGVTPDLLPFLSSHPFHPHPPPEVIHKNSAYYNRGDMPPGTRLLQHELQVSSFDHTCEWNNCRLRFATVRELLGHIEEEHITLVPWGRVRGGVVCRWRECGEVGRVFPARYKLLLHVQQAHCKGRPQRTNPNQESGKPSPPPPTSHTPHPLTIHRKPAVRSRRESVDRTVAHGNHPGKTSHHPPHPSTEHPPTIPELVIAAQPVVARRTRTQNPSYYRYKHQRTPAGR